MLNSPTYFLENYNHNDIYIKRDDLIPYSFGGNKARKAFLFFNDILEKKADVVITYGSASSNHCRIIANKCCEHRLQCVIITTETSQDETFNLKLIKSFGARVITTKVEKVKDTIEQTISEYRQLGYNPYFIQGGGHGNIGTRAYELAYDEIVAFEKEQGFTFDYICFASGTGTTQAGLIIGNKKHQSKSKIVGFTVARNSEYGSRVIRDSLKEYGEADAENLDIYFIDRYLYGGYGAYNEKIEACIIKMMHAFGIPMDPTYTGKAMNAMYEYIDDQKLENKKILFIHTGGTPLFFDYISKRLG